MRIHLVTFFFCLALAVLFTLPVSVSPRSALLGSPGDNYQHAWFLWYFAKAVAKGHNPFYTRLIFYPSGVNLSWSTFDPLAGLLALPFSVTVGPVVAYNVSLVLQLALTAFFARLLCLKICGNEAAATIGGVAFGFSPFLLAHALGHLSLVTAFPIPAYALALHRLLNEENPSAKDGAILGLALLLTAFAHYNYTAFCVMFTAAVIGADFLSEGTGILRRVWKPFCVASLTFLAGFSPLLALLLGNRGDVPTPRTLEHVEKYSADALGFLIPSWNHLLLGGFARTWDRSIFTAGFEGTVYVGPFVLLLAFVGLRQGRITQQRWATRAMLAGAIFYLFSLGPRVRLLGRQTGIPAPAGLIYHLHSARFLSAPARFHVLTTLCLSILVSIGLASLLNRLTKKWQRWLLVSAVSFLLVLDSITVPFPGSSITNPTEPAGASGTTRACNLPSSVRNGTVLTFPLVDWPYSVQSMWMQVSDDGRYSLVDGYTSYIPERIWRERYSLSILRSLLSLQGELHSPVDLQSDRQSASDIVHRLNLSAVVVFDSPQHDAATRYVEAVFGLKGQEAGDCTVFEIEPNQTAAKTGESKIMR